MKTYSNIVTKRAMLEVLERLYRDLDDEKQNCLQVYKQVGVDETKQRRSWKTDELLWEDEEHTIPQYEPIYDYVDKTDEEMSDEDVAKLDAINTIVKTLDKLV